MSKGSPKYLLERLSAASRYRDIQWPLPLADTALDEAPIVRVRVLAGDALEAAHCAVLDHFAGMKREVDPDSDLFLGRERYELVHRAFVDPETGEPCLATSADQVAARLTSLERDELYTIWRRLQQDVASAPPTSEQLEQLIEEAKKKPHVAPWLGFTSSWLSALITGLAARLEASTTPRSAGSSP